MERNLALFTGAIRKRCLSSDFGSGKIDNIGPDIFGRICWNREDIIVACLPATIVSQTVFCGASCPELIGYFIARV
jgi:hypothetical protein